MKYMLLIYSPESSWTKDEWLACTQESSKICHELESRGAFIAASPLEPIATASCVRVRDNQTLVTAGPFAETIEQLGGFFLIDLPNLDQAIQIASQLPAAKKGTVEIRPIMPLADLPEVASPKASQKREGDKSEYMLLCYDHEPSWNNQGESAKHNAMQEAAGMAQRLADRDQYVMASPLQAISMATSVRVRDGRCLVTDGPFAETREILGGFYIIRVRDLNDAISIAAKHPGSRFGTVEVRKLYQLDT